MDFKRPKDGFNQVYSTPMAAVVGELTGSTHYKGVSYIEQEFKALQRFYGFTNDDENYLTQAGNRRNLMRQVSMDGFRIMAFLSQYLEEGEDPVLLVANALAGYGLDVLTWDDE
jgi:hypothetical protein